MILMKNRLMFFEKAILEMSSLREKLYKNVVLKEQIWNAIFENTFPENIFWKFSKCIFEEEIFKQKLKYIFDGGISEIYSVRQQVLFIYLFFEGEQFWKYNFCKCNFENAFFKGEIFENILINT